MYFESATEFFTRAILERIDPGAEQTVVEVGMGGQHFSFLWAAPKGHRCIAVEPLPVDVLRAEAARLGVELIEAGLSDKKGEAPLYHGSVDGEPVPDMNSLHREWFGAGDASTVVPLLSLPALLESRGVEKLGLLKIDTEGHETAILSRMADVPPLRRPAVITLEYGGGDIRSTGLGAWGETFTRPLFEELLRLRDLGYDRWVFFDITENEPILAEGSRIESVAGVDALFRPTFKVGNLALVHRGVDARAFVGVLADLKPELRRGAEQEARDFRRGRRKVILSMVFSSPGEFFKKIWKRLR